MEKGQTVGIIEAMKLMNEIEVRHSCCTLSPAPQTLETDPKGWRCCPCSGVRLAEQSGGGLSLTVMGLGQDAPGV